MPTIYHVDRFLDANTARAYQVIVMDLVEGLSLRTFTTDDITKLAIRDIWRHLCAALQVCHAAQLFHGDLESLDNVLISPPGSVFLIDPGLSRGIVEERSYSGFREADLRGLVKAAAKLFQHEFDIPVTDRDSVETIQKQVEKDLASELADENYAYSLARRLEFISKGDPRKLSAPYALDAELVTLAISPAGHTRYVYRSVISPILPVGSIRQSAFFDRPVTYAELGLSAELYELDGGQLPAVVRVERSVSKPYEAIFYYSMTIDPPLAPGQSYELFITFSHPDAMDGRHDSFSYDVTAAVRYLRLEFHFRDGSPPPAHEWTAAVQVPGMSPVRRHHADFLELVGSLAYCRFENLLPPAAVHVGYGHDIL